MPATLRDLLALPAFRLRLVAGASDAQLLDQPITWAHSSDLVDPTPWLEHGQLLLTDGVHFEPDSPDDFAAPYVARLRERGVRALGFATDIVHAVIPPALVRACDAQGLPLLDVAERTPFMGIIRHVADVISREQRERLEWSLQAQRAVARAALRPDGLGAIVTELERQLGCWVALYDAVGNRVQITTTRAIPDAAADDVRDEVRRALARGTRSGSRLTEAASGVTLQTLGRRDRLRGVLAVGTTAPLDPAGNDLVASVIGLASIALEQRSALDTARRQLRAGLLELLLAGEFEVALATARRLWGELPPGPIRVVTLAEPVHGDSLLDELELSAEELFFAERDGLLAVITADTGLDAVRELLGRHEVTAGASAPVAWSDLSRGVVEAGRAALRATSDRPFVHFDRLAQEGMLGLLESAGAEPVALRMLDPLLSTADGRSQLESIRVWLRYNAAWDPASAELGVHRHTLRNRVHAVERALALDLDTFADRAELWTALQFVD